MLNPALPLGWWVGWRQKGEAAGASRLLLWAFKCWPVRSVRSWESATEPGSWELKKVWCINNKPIACVHGRVTGFCMRRCDFEKSHVMPRCWCTTLTTVLPLAQRRKLLEFAERKPNKTALLTPNKQGRRSHWCWFPNSCVYIECCYRRQSL